MLLCIGAATLWVRSYWGSDYVARGKTISADPMVVVSRAQQLSWTQGEIRWQDGEQRVYPRGQWASGQSGEKPWIWGYGRLGQKHWGWEKYEGRTFWEKVGFKQYPTGLGTSWSDSDEKVTTIPAWLPVVVFGVWPVARGVGWYRRRRRYGAGRCAGCGYDLRATPQRCPECGREARV